VVPVLYDLFNGKKMKAREIEMMKEAAGMSREGFNETEPALVPAAQPVSAVESEPASAPQEAVEETKVQVNSNRSRRIKIRF
jgi:hypothetical protein